MPTLQSILSGLKSLNLSGPNPPIPNPPVPNSSIPVSPGPGTCVNCKFQPQARDPTTGQYYLFCSNACAAPRTLMGLPTVSNIDGGPGTNTGMNMNTDATLTPSPSLCAYCNKRPRYREGVIEHPYCGRTCANLAKGRGPTNVNTPAPISPVQYTNPFIIPTTNPIKPTIPGNADSTNALGAAVSTNPRNSLIKRKVPPIPVNPRHSVVLTDSTNPPNRRSSVYWKTSASTCKIPGCSSPVYVNQSGVASKYCTKTHMRWGKHGCISCRNAPTNGVTVFCQSCNETLSMAPIVVEVPKDHERYKSVASQFQQKWLHNAQCPEVRAIYKIVSTAASLARYEQYLDRVEAKHNFASRPNGTRGNERRRWHGTTRKCRIGDKGMTSFCSDPSCSLCCIMKTSFDLSFFRRKTGWGMFGAGVYTSSTSSKSNSYSQNDCTSNWKAMLLNKVVVGNGFKMTVSNSTLTEPPTGYDSVLGEVGGRLNYDELVVYDNDAIRPSYLVMYDTPT